MPDATRYGDVETLKEWIAEDPTQVLNANDQSYDTLLGDLLDAASRRIDDDCGRIFYEQTATARSFYPNRVGVVEVTDLLSVTSILIDTDGDDVAETTLASTDYVLEPLTEESGIGVARYQRIRAARNGAYMFAYRWKMTVTGSWGYVDSQGRAPDSIRTAAMILASRWFMRRHAKFGRMVIPESGMTETLPVNDPDYAMLIQPYIHDERLLDFA